MRFTTHGMLYVGRLELVKRIHDLTSKERERLADVLSGYAADIRKEAVTGALTVDLYVERGE